MNKEEKEAIKELIDSSNLSLIGDGTMIVKNTTIATILNYIDKLQKENEKTYYVAVDIGCIECGEESTVLGIFDTKKQAEKVCKENEKIQNDNWTGQHYFYVDIIKKINKEYSPYKGNNSNSE